MRRVTAGLPTPGSSEASRIQLAVDSELKRADEGGVNGGGGRGGVRSRRVQPTNTVDASSVARQGRGGTLLTNPA